MKLIYENFTADYEQAHSPDGEKVIGRFVCDIYGFAVVQLEQSEWEDFLDARASGLSVDEAFNELAHETRALLPLQLNSVQWKVRAHYGRDFCVSVESFDSDVETVAEMKRALAEDDGDRRYHDLHDEGLI